MKIFSSFALLYFKIIFCDAGLSSLMESLENEFVDLKEQDSSSLPISPPISEKGSILTEESEFLVKERKFSSTGEDFDVFLGEKQFLQVRGSVLSHIPGFDMMYINLFEEDAEKPTQVAKLMRLGDALVLYRDTEAFFDTEAICWIYQEDGDNFRVYKDKQKLHLIYYFSGEFIGRDIIMKNTNKEPVAIIYQRLITEAKVMEIAADVAGLDVAEAELENVQSYDVKIAKGMDAILVLACTIAIDETFDDARKAERKEEKEEL